MSSTRLVSPADVPVRLLFTIAGTELAGAKIVGTIQAFGADVAPVDSEYVPAREVWHVMEIHTDAVADKDGIVQILVDGIPQATQPRLAQLLTSLFKPFTLRQSMVLANSSKITVALVLLEDATKSATQEVGLTLKRVPLR